MGSDTHPLQSCHSGEFCGVGRTDRCEPLGSCLDGSYCAAHGNGALFCDLDEDARTALCRPECQNDGECMALLPQTPMCSGSGQCIQCERGTDCDSGLCEANHMCVAMSAVAYAAPNGLGTACTQEAPCRLADAIALVGEAVRYIKLAPTPGDTYYDGRFELGGLRVTIIGELGPDRRPLATISAYLASPDPIVRVDGAAAAFDVTLSGIRVRGGAAPLGYVSDNINCAGVGRLTLVDGELVDATGVALAAQDGCDVVMTRSTITKNALGGIAVMDSFDITNNVIAFNGELAGPLFADDPIGDVYIDSASAGTTVFAHNTVISQPEDAASVASVYCKTTSDVALRNNIIRLRPSGGLANQVKLESNCRADFTASEVSIGANPVVTTSFPFAFGSSPLDVHLTADLPAQGGAGSGVTVDFDGDVRDANAPDIGADERH